MKKNEEIKKLVREKYDQIALQDKVANAQSCCGGTTTSNEVYNIMTDDYSQVEGYNPDADLGLGCGIPSKAAGFQPGDVVIDLGSGAGNDCFIARQEVGEKGKVIGIDFSDAMIRKARQNVDKFGLNNVEFRKGDIEDMPVGEDVADVVISNCVLNLVPDKARAFSEIFRVLKPGGHFAISDVVLVGDLPDTLLKDAEMYVGCVAGAISKTDYLDRIGEAGFKDLSIEKEKEILIPRDILANYLTEEQTDSFLSSGTGIYSITVKGVKPGEKHQKIKRNLSDLIACCDPSEGCC